MCRFSSRTKISIFSPIKLVAVLPYFIYISTIGTNTSVHTFNMRMFNITKTIFMWLRNAYMMRYYAVYMNLMNPACKLTFMVKMFSRNTKCTCNTKQWKMQLVSMHLKCSFKSSLYLPWQLQDFIQKYSPTGI